MRYFFIFKILIDLVQKAYLKKKIYRKIAINLTVWENHRTKTEYDDSLILKLFAFEFVNNYGNLFYLAYFRNNVSATMFENFLNLKLTDWSYRIFNVFSLIFEEVYSTSVVNIKTNAKMIVLYSYLFKFYLGFLLNLSIAF